MPVLESIERQWCVLYVESTFGSNLPTHLSYMGIAYVLGHFRHFVRSKRHAEIAFLRVVVNLIRSSLLPYTTLA